MAPYRESLSRLLAGSELSGAPYYLLTYFSLALFYVVAMHAGSIWVPLQFVGATAGTRWDWCRGLDPGLRGAGVTAAAVKRGADSSAHPPSCVPRRRADCVHLSSMDRAACRPHARARGACLPGERVREGACACHAKCAAHSLRGPFLMFDAAALQRYWSVNAWALIAIGVAQAVAGVTATLFFSPQDGGKNGALAGALAAALF